MEINKEINTALKKERIIYCGELAFFAVLFLVLGILFGTHVIGISDWKRYVFTILTTIGGIWLPIDLIWTLRSPARRKKNSLLDKILPVPSALGLLAVDIYVYIKGFMNVEENVFSTTILIVFSYLCLVYIVEAVYHWFFPHPLLIIALEEEQAEEAKAKEEAERKAKEEAEASENKTEQVEENK